MFHVSFPSTRPHMRSVYNIASKTRHRLRGNRIRQKTSKLEPAVRTALVQDVQQDADLAQTLEELQQELQQLQEKFQASQAKEVFLHQRLEHYQKVLDAQAKELKQEQTTHDEETSPDLEQRLVAWERDQDSLTKIQMAHRSILIHNESLRRQIRTLEKRQATLEEMQQECDDFLTAAARLRQEEEDDGDGHVELAMSQEANDVEEPPAAEDDDEEEKEEKVRSVSPEYSRILL